MKIYRCYTNHENFNSLSEGEFEAIVKLIRVQGGSFNLYEVIDIKKPNKEIQKFITSLSFDNNGMHVLLNENEIVEELNEEEYPEYFI